VVTPGGDDVRNITIYEFCLSAGDVELAKQVKPYFNKIVSIDGNAEEARQYERYRPHIKTMLTQSPYDLTPLMTQLNSASDNDLTALLNHDVTYTSKLRDTINQFRNDFAPRIIDKPCMLYNYQ